MDKPKLKLTKTTTDLLLEGVSILAILLTFSLVTFYYNQLPDKIAHHFDASGKPDGFGSKTTLIILPIISLILTIFMLLLCKIPHLFNYPFTINNQNAEIQYRMSTKMMRSITMIMAVLFLDITYQTIRVALEKQGGLYVISILLFFVIIAILLVNYYYQAKKIK